MTTTLDTSKIVQRKRANVNAAAGNLRMILNLTKHVDWDSEPDISSIIETARLARAALADLGFDQGGGRP